MPKIRRRGVPPNLVTHLVERAIEREIDEEDIRLVSQWLDLDRTVPAGKWFKRFPRMFLCGEGELVKTVLRIGQLPTGEEVQ